MEKELKNLQKEMHQINKKIDLILQKNQNMKDLVLEDLNDSRKIMIEYLKNRNHNPFLKNKSDIEIIEQIQKLTDRINFLKNIQRC